MNMKLGLVLSGGGAKGAYEVGVVKALARLGVEPAVVTGASIGALNGAVVAASSDMGVASANLERVWRGITLEQMLPVDIRTDGADMQLCDKGPLRYLLIHNVDFGALCAAKYRDFYVSVFPGSDRTVDDFCQYIASVKDSVFVRIADCSKEKAIKFLLASASLPFLYNSEKIDGSYYRDGGMGGRLFCQGNTPVEPIIKSGCTHAVVVLPSDGALWNRYEWRDVVPIEIRPSVNIETEGSMRALMDFSSQTIQKLILQGEEDALKSISRLGEAHGQVLRIKEASIRMDVARQDDMKLQEPYDDAIRKSNEYFRGSVEE